MKMEEERIALKIILSSKKTGRSGGSKGGFPLSRNFYVRTDVNFNWLYVRKLK